MSRILLIDDDEMTLMMLRTILSDAGYAVTATADGPRGIDLYKELRPELVLLDVGLPGMSGMFLFHLLKQGPHTAAIPMVFVIPAGDPVAERVCLEAGAAGCIAKPVQAEDLFRIVQGGSAKASEQTPDSPPAEKTEAPARKNKAKRSAPARKPPPPQPAELEPEPVEIGDDLGEGF